MTTNQDHILLSSMGTSLPKANLYVLGDRNATSRFSAFALRQLLAEDQRPSQVWFLLTPKAKREAWLAIERDAQKEDLAVEPVLLCDQLPDDTQNFLETVAGRIPRGCRLTLDVTQGLRHHAFLFFALALYLSEFHDVELCGAWYNRWEIGGDNKPFIDLTPTLELVRWFHALAVFRESGSLREVARRMRAGEQKDRIDRLASFFVNGMPLETGNEAACILAGVPEQPLVTDVPLAEQLQSAIRANVEPLAGATFDRHPNKGKPQRAKRNVPLTLDELKRQANCIERYFETGQLNLAFGLMREWVVNWIAWKRQEADSWLERPVREAIERNLGGLAEVLKAKDPKDSRRKEYKHAAIRAALSESQRQWAKRWSTVCDIRNALQHHGMKPTIFEPHRQDIENARQDWQQWEQWESPPDFGGGHGRLLICPLGLTPGVLYSAIRQMDAMPEHVVVICSQESASCVDEALRRACDHRAGDEESHPNDLRLIMRDPYTGVDEFSGLVSQASSWLFQADEIHASLTGGTTLMGVLVSELIKRAQREYQRPVREFVLIDRRTPEQQRADPWQLGEIHYLDGEPRLGHGGEKSGHESPKENK